MSKKGIPIIPCVAVILIGASCISGQRERSYRNNYVRQIPSGEAVTAVEDIDGARTYQFFFKIKEPTDCIRIVINAIYTTDTLPPKKVSVKTFFLVEKLFNIGMFHQKEREIYTTVAQNFSSQWEHQPSVTICTSKTEPLQKLDPVSRYRVRYSALSDSPFLFTLTISADTEIYTGF
ncbi:MAG: hypothetical protein JXA20_12540 [Spirochaetes bacterium]|nr:hypothetical protein [Spirochaetota bacterium]